MLGKIRNLLIASAASTLVVLSLVGTISATLSWFSYSTKVSGSYHGTAIASNKQLQVGIVTDYDLREVDLESDGGIAWSLPGVGLSANQISKYLSSIGHAIDTLRPVTSKEYSAGDEFNLYEQPYDFDPDNINIATNEKYVKLPLAFRVVNVGNGFYLQNKDIWVTDATVVGQAFEGFELKDGVRVSFYGDSSKFILNPAQTERGSTYVAGLLDFNEDGYYDYNSNNEEIIYGTYGGTPTYSEPTGTDSELDDIYETGNNTEYIFLSKHKSTSKTISNYDDLVIGKADYETLNSVAPDISSTGVYSGGIPIANTGSSGIGYTNMTIYVEGWDQSCVNQVSGLRFQLGLTFEINKN